MRYIIITSLLLISLSISGCSIPKVRKLDVEQGNIITQKEVDLLRPNMSKEQVQYLLGAPLLISPYQDAPLYYVYTFKKGHGNMEQKRLVLFFADNRLINMVTTVPPTGAADETTHPENNLPESVKAAENPDQEELDKQMDRDVLPGPALVNPQSTEAERDNNL